MKGNLVSLVQRHRDISMLPGDVRKQPENSTGKAQVPPVICRWKDCDRPATGPDGMCDRCAIEYWRAWRDRQPDVWIDVTCFRCHNTFSIPVKVCDGKHIWPYKLCRNCGAS